MSDRELLELAAKGRRRERHGLNKSPEHRAWVHMRQRCSNPNKKEWPHYGGRGIRVCERWNKSFVAFLSDMGRRPSPNHSVDRINVNGNYEPGNVRWATKQQQIENTRVVRMVTINGCTKSISAWERENRLPRGTVRRREQSGWSLAEAITTPTVRGQKLHMNVKRDYARAERDWHGRYMSTAIVRAAAEIGKAMP